MLLRRCAVVVMGQDAPRVESEGAMDGLPCHRAVFVEEAGRTVGKVAIAGEEIAAEENPVRFAPVSRVSRGVAGKGDGAQTLPDWKFISVSDEAIWSKRLEPLKDPSRVFDPVDGSEGPTGVNPALAAIPVSRRRGDPGSVASGEAGGVADVVEVTVGENNAPDGEVIPPPFREGIREGAFRPDEPGVDEMQVLPVFQDIEPNAPGMHREAIVCEVLEGRFHVAI